MRPVMPIPRFCLSLAQDVPGLRTAPDGGAATGRLDNLDTAFTVALKHRSDGMAKAVAVAGLGQCKLRLDSIQKNRAGRRFAAVMRHQQKIGSQFVPGLRVIGKPELLRRFKVASQQCSLRAV